MRLNVPLIAVASFALLVSGCHSSSTAGDSVTNMVVDNTVGTASDAMTNVDATTGSATNMAADVGDATNAGGGTSGADKGSKDNAAN